MVGHVIEIEKQVACTCACGDVRENWLCGSVTLRDFQREEQQSQFTLDQHLGKLQTDAVS